MKSSLQISVKYIYNHFLTFKAKNAKISPMLVGLSGLQGSGKSTLTSQLLEALSQPPYNLKVCAFSLDDFYLSYKEQLALSLKYKDNKLLEFRGNPGTHDIDLLNKIVKDLCSNNKTSIKIPFFDKLLNSGKGDRVEEERWLEVKLPVDLIIIEGWMVGFKPLSEAEINKIYHQDKADDKSMLDKLGADQEIPEFRQYSLEDLLILNHNLGLYSNLFNSLNYYIILKGKKLSYVYNWREEQELYAKSKVLSSGNNVGLNKEQIREFVKRFVPAYELYLNQLYFNNDYSGLMLELDQDRNLLNHQNESANL